MAASAILVIDDDPGIREVISECLRAEGYEVEAVRNGAEGLARLRARRADVVILDQIMPIMGGAEFLERLRADAAIRDVPVVLMSGLTPTAAQGQPRADVVLPKPFEIDELVAALARLGAPRGGA